MRQAEIYRNNKLAGFLTEKDRRNYVFIYEDTYLNDNLQPAISLTLPKSRKEYQSEYLFPFFFNMLSEGVNRKLQCMQLRIDEEDNFGLLMATTQYDTVGAITVKPVDVK